MLVVQLPQLVAALGAITASNPMLVPVGLLLAAIGALARAAQTRATSHVCGIESGWRRDLELSATAYATNRVVKSGGLAGLVHHLADADRHHHPRRGVTLAYAVSKVSDMVAFAVVTVLAVGIGIVTGVLSGAALVAGSITLGYAMVQFGALWLVIRHPRNLRRVVVWAARGAGPRPAPPAERRGYRRCRGAGRGRGPASDGSGRRGAGRGQHVRRQARRPRDVAPRRRRAWGHGRSDLDRSDLRARSGRRDARTASRRSRHHRGFARRHARHGGCRCECRRRRGGGVPTVRLLAADGLRLRSRRVHFVSTHACERASVRSATPTRTCSSPTSSEESRAAVGARHRPVAEVLSELLDGGLR